MKREKDFARAGRENEESVWGANVVGEAGQLVATVTSSTIQTTEYTELQPLLSGVHSVMRVKLVLVGEGGGCTPTPSHYIYPHQ